MTWRRLLLALLLVADSLAADSTWPERPLLSTGNPDYPPSSWAVQGSMLGVADELLWLIVSDAGLSVESRVVVPWARAQLAVREGDIDVIYSAYKTPEREADLIFTAQPYMEDPNVVWVWQGRSFPFSRWEDLRGRRGGAVLGDSYGPEFDQFMRQQLAVERVASIEQNLLKLQAGRIDYMPYGLYAGMIAAKKMGLEKQLHPLPQPLLSEGLYFAVSRRSAYAGLIPLLNAGVAKYRADGTVDRLIKKSLHCYSLARAGQPLPQACRRGGGRAVVSPAPAAP